MTWGNELIVLPQADVTDVIAADAGLGHSIALKEDGTIVVWGDNHYGQINVPTPNADFVAIAAGNHHSLGLKQNGSVIAWGLNSDGQCNVSQPNENFIAIAAGRKHSVGIRADVPQCNHADITAMAW